MLTAPQLLATSILTPIISALLLLAFRGDRTRTAIVWLTAIILAGSSLGLLSLGSFTYEVENQFWNTMITGLDLALSACLLFIALRIRHIGILVLTLLQAIPLVWLEATRGHELTVLPTFAVDSLSLVLSLLVSLVGSLVVVFALGYMKRHEEHQHLERSRQPRFFFFLMIFLGAMNALVLSNSLLWVYFFWELTTLCSFMLISHDGTAEALASGTRALWMNSVGGLAFVAAIVILAQRSLPLGLMDLALRRVTGTQALLPLALLTIAGMTKAAQLPFQNWLLGAMVAPTPVSGLLHSSTMVKAGVYIIIRLAPAYQGTQLANLIAIAGSFTFLITSALAISQSNAKRILAYSTIANLGLIIACAGIDTPLSVAAATLLILFHAISKGLLFLCVGTIEQGIGSRDIEDMDGLLVKMPYTATITVVGVISMLLPPFGVLVGKWATIEAATRMPAALVMIILGSALTVVYYVKWIGHLTSIHYQEHLRIESLPRTMAAPLLLLGLGILGSSFFVAPIYSSLVAPLERLYYHTLALAAPGNRLVSSVGSFIPLPLFNLLFLIFLAVPIFGYTIRPSVIKPAYLCGEQVDEAEVDKFTGPQDRPQELRLGNYYLSRWLSERQLGPVMTIGGIAVMAVMLGVIR
ncbi:MAG: NADH-quinone oxidoreductase subunit L [Bacillota bacterium]